MNHNEQTGAKCAEKIQTLIGDFLSACHTSDYVETLNRLSRLSRPLFMGGTSEEVGNRLNFISDQLYKAGEISRFLGNIRKLRQFSGM